VRPELVPLGTTGHVRRRLWGDRGEGLQCDKSLPGPWWEPEISGRHRAQQRWDRNPPPSLPGLACGSRPRGGSAGWRPFWSWLCPSSMLVPRNMFSQRQTDRQTHTHTHTHTHRVKVWFVKKPDAPEMKLWGPIAYEGPSTLKGQQAAFLTAEQPPWWHSLLKREKAGQEGPPKSLLCGNITSGPSLLPVASSATETRVDSLMEKWPVL